MSPLAAQPQPQGSQRTVRPLADGDGTGEAVEEQEQQSPEELSLWAPHPRASLGLCTKPCPTLRVILSDFNGWLFTLTRCRTVSQEVLSALFLTEDENSKPGIPAPWVQTQLSTEKPISVQHADLHCFLKVE